MAVDRRRGLIAAGVGLLALAGLLALDGQQKTTTTPGSPTHPHGAGQLLRVGSTSLRRPAWVHDHGCNAPLYNGTIYGLAGWVPCGTELRATGPVYPIAQPVVNSNGTTDGELSGAVPSWPVRTAAGVVGWLSVSDVDAIAG